MKCIEGDLGTRSISFPIAIIVSAFNRSVTQALLEGTLDKLSEYHFKQEDITVVQVPGALEIPLIAKRLAREKQQDVIIALGAVIRGETTHYDYVCQQVSEGCQRVSLDFEIPVVFGVLTTENEAQAWDRLGGQHGHKGADAADCAIAMYSVLKQLE